MSRLVSESVLIEALTMFKSRLRGTQSLCHHGMGAVLLTVFILKPGLNEDESC